jgi:hypothetical protein
MHAKAYVLFLGVVLVMIAQTMELRRSPRLALLAQKRALGACGDCGDCGDCIEYPPPKRTEESFICTDLLWMSVGILVFVVIALII